MNHVSLRRCALTLAAVSFGVLTTLVMVVLAVPKQLPSHSAEPKLQYDTITMDDLPCAISCTDLVVENLSLYDGPFFEDNNPREVFNVAAIVVTNRGDAVIPYASISVCTPGITYEFEGFMLVPGTSVLIPEKNATVLSDKTILHCYGWTTVAPEQKIPIIDIAETQKGTLEVTNTQLQDYCDITLYYKTYIQQSDIYIGGRAFQMRIASLPAGDTVELLPGYYCPGYSRLLCWYGTDLMEI